MRQDSLRRGGRLNCGVDECCVFHRVGYGNVVRDPGWKPNLGRVIDPDVPLDSLVRHRIDSNERTGHRSLKRTCSASDGRLRRS